MSAIEGIIIRPKHIIYNGDLYELVEEDVPTVNELKIKAFAEKEGKCETCNHYVTSGLKNNDFMHPQYEFKCNIEGCNYEECE